MTDSSPWRWALMACAMALLLVVSTAAAAAELAGRVIVKLGDVTATAADGTTRELRRRSPVYAGDTVTTGTRGRAQIRFTDGGLLSVRPNTEMALDEYEFKNANTDRTRINLRRGGFRTVTGRIARNNRMNYRVATPLAVIGVRGTDWEALQQPAAELLIGVTDGGINAESISGQTADLGNDQDFSYAQVNPDGTIDFLLFPPVELNVTPDLDEQGDEEGGDTDESGTTDEVAALGDASEAGTPPPTTQADTPDVEISLTDQAQINPLEEGDGSPDELPQVDLQGPSGTEIAGLLGGDQIGVFGSLKDAITQEFLEATFNFLGTQGPSSGTELTPEEIALLLDSLEPFLRGGLAAPSDDGDVVFAFSVDAFGGFPFDFASRTREENFLESQYLLDDENVNIIQDQVDAGGISGVRLGVYDASDTNPLNLTLTLPPFTDEDIAALTPQELTDLGFNSAAELSAALTELLTVNRTAAVTEPVAFGVGPHLADLTASGAFYVDTAFAATTNADSVNAVTADMFFDINLGNGTVTDGILDVEVQAGSNTGVFVVDFVGSINQGIFDLTATFADFFEGITLPDVDGPSNIGPGIPAIADLTAFTTGTAANPGIILGFDYEAQSTFLTEPLFARGAVLLQEDPNPPLFGQGFLFSAADCCFDTTMTPMDDLPIVFGRAEDGRLNGGDILVGFNVDGLGDPLSPTATGFSDLPVAQLFDNRNATITQVLPDPSIFDADSVTLLRWDADPGDPFQNIDNVTGTVLDTDIGSIIAATFRPTDIANVDSLATAGFAVFYSGETEFATSGDPKPLTAVGLVIDQFGGPPAEQPLLNFTLSFGVDPLSGDIYNGSLFAVLDDTGFTEEGFAAFFEGFYASTDDGGAVADLFGFDVDGTLFNIFALNSDSSGAGAFVGTGDAFAGTVNLYYTGTGGTNNTQAAVSFVMNKYVDLRIPAAEARDYTHAGLMAFNGRDAGGNFQTAQYPEGIGPGLLAGYSTSASPLINPNGPKLLANNGPLSEYTAFILPADNLISAGTAPVFQSANAVQGLILPSLGGFDVSWGVWNANSAVQAVSAQNNRNNASNQLLIDRDTFFVSLEQLTRGEDIAARTGSASMSMSFSGSPTISGDALARGGSLATPANTDAITSMSSFFNINFDTGAITGGSLTVDYFNSLQPSLVGNVTFSAGFSGQLRGAITDLQINTLTVNHAGTGGPQPGNIPASALSGALTGPIGEVFVGAFSLSGQGEHVEGVYIGEVVVP